MRGRHSEADGKCGVLAFVELKFTDYVNDAPGACSQSVSTIRLYLDLLSPAQPSCGPVIWNFKITHLLFFQKKIQMNQNGGLPAQEIQKACQC